jgi:hypothetical protein
VIAGCAFAAAGVGAENESVPAPDPSAPGPEITETPLGRFSLAARLRYEFADIDGLDESHAVTLRGRLGFRTKKWQGLQAFAEVEGIVALDDDAYFDAASRPSGKAAVADPEDADLNQLYLSLDLPVADGKIVGGRQRIVFDDARFVGDVGWRQNDQVFDAIQATTSLGVDDLALTYAFVWDVHRIFGDKGTGATRDFDSSSHLVNLSWSGLPNATLTAFAYLLDFGNAAAASTNTLGTRLSGGEELSADWSMAWSFSFAWQTDAHHNAVSYDAFYWAADLGIRRQELGTAGVGWETLGSDHGRARFVTPLATAHKFNGWADVFLDNGGPTGLRDLYLYVSPRLPWGLKTRLVYHQFWADDGGNTIGHEWDASIGRALTKRTNLLLKAARFEGRRGGRADRTRLSIQLDTSF